MRSYRGANIDSDHYLLGAKVRARISNIKKITGGRQKRYNISRLKDIDRLKVIDRFQEVMNEQLCTQECEMQNMSTTEIWERCKNALIKTGNDVLGECRRQDKTEWFDDERTGAGRY